MDQHESGFWYKFGRYLLILLAIATIFLDLNKMIHQYEKAEYLVIVSKLDTVNYYSSSIITHLIGLAAAVEHEIWLSVLCRLVSACVYHINLKEQANGSIPQDLKKLKKLLRKNVRQNPHQFKPLNLLDLLSDFVCKGKIASLSDHFSSRTNK